MSLDPELKLRIAPNLRVECRSANEFKLQVGAVAVDGGPHTLPVLNAFRAPTSMRLALEAIRPQLRGAHDWIGLSGAVIQLHKHGVLIDAQAQQERFPAPIASAGFHSPPVHIAMLNDHARTSLYLQAIRASVRPGDVVVDLGTGSGVLAIAAALAGASHVYAIEATGIAATARRMFAANGVADRITLVEGHSTQLQLPEAADLLVAEIIGNDPLAEQVLESTADAVRRFLNPGARLLPQRLRVWAAPVSLPPSRRNQWLFGAQQTQKWQQDYGIDFSALSDSRHQAPMRMFAAPKHVAEWKHLAEARLAGDFDLRTRMASRSAIELEFPIAEKGRVDGILIWFSATLTDSIELSTDPRQYRADNHWSHPLWLFAQGQAVQPGQRLRCTLPAGESMEQFSMSVE